MFQIDNELLSTGIVILDKEYHVVSVNLTLCKLTGIEREKVLGLDVNEILSDFPKTMDGEDTFEMMAQKKVGFTNCDIDNVISGEKTTFRIELNYIAFANNTYLFCFLSDVPGQLKAMQSSREIAILLEAMFNSIRDPIGIIDTAMHIQYYNDAALKIFKKQIHEVVGKKCFTLMGYQNVCTDCVVKKVIKTGKPAQTLRHLEDTDQYWEMKAYPIMDENGNVSRVIEQLYDLTDIKRAEEKLKRTYQDLLISEKDKRLSHFVIDRAGEGMYLVNSEGAFVRVNDKACLFWGYDRSELIHQHIGMINPRLKIPKWEKIWNEFVRNQSETIEDVHYRKDKSSFPVEVNLNLIEYEGERYVVGFVRDISERKKYENNLKNALNEIEYLKNRLVEENLYLQNEIKLDHNFDEIITQNFELKKILSNVEKVASTNSTVLITGETGTGKELLARAIHNISKRNNRPLVKVNCAALPSSLIESELFGYEKGAFTGALQRKIGRFELADKGTIFLDEIGEIPVDLQAKLLRVLQDGEFERLGNSNTIKVDVRVIAATNRDLNEEVLKKNFRSDLFYRLNVFPVYIPPLRERKEDIPLLVNHFIIKHSTRLGKQINSVPHKTMATIQKYDWPGNIRELENLIERYMITSKSNLLEISDVYLEGKTAASGNTITTLEENERKHILSILEQTSYRIRGKHGAAEILKIKPTTLEARMKKLGINRNKI